MSSLREPGYVLLLWLAGDLRAQSLPEEQWIGGSARPHALGFCPVGMRLKTPVPRCV